MLGDNQRVSDSSEAMVIGHVFKFELNFIKIPPCHSVNYIQIAYHLGRHDGWGGAATVYHCTVTEQSQK